MLSPFPYKNGKVISLQATTTIFLQNLSQTFSYYFRRMKMNLGWMRVVAKLVGEDKMIKKGGLLKKKVSELGL